MNTCTHCGSENPPHHRFCSECGAAIATRPAPPAARPAPRGRTGRATRTELPTPAQGVHAPLEGERKQVTVLFADIKGSLELLADRDPEDANRLLDTVLHRMMDAVHRYEGTVSQARGDGVMAIFGAPLAQEGHALRACHAALRMQETISGLAAVHAQPEAFPVQVRVGLNSGEVVVRAIRNDLYMEYTAVGQTVHLAARMEQLAPPGRIFATAHTVRLALGEVQTRALGPLDIRGLDAPVEVHELTGADDPEARPAFVRGRGLTPFIGRAAAIEQLRAALVDAEAGLGQAIGIVGDAGVGKSRLVHEFVELAENTEWKVVECSAGGRMRARAYAPFIAWLRAEFGIDDADSAATVGEKIAAHLRAEPDADPADLPALLDLLEALPPAQVPVAADAAQQRQAHWQALTRRVLLASRKRPLVLILEGLNHHDSLSLQWLAHLVERIDQDRVLLITTERPSNGEPAVLGEEVQRLELEPLDDEKFSELLQALLGDDPSMRSLRPFLRQHAAGNPFFAEEIVRTLADTGLLEGPRGAHRLTGPLPQFRIPETVQALLAARIDRLPAAEKRALQHAAVIGAPVPFGLLRSVTGQTATQLRQTMAQLVSAGLLLETRLQPEPEYIFRHGLTHEVAYAELLRSQRSAIHARVVTAIEAHYPQRLGEWTAQLGEHAYHGRVWDKAIDYLRQAAVRAAERQAYGEAAALYERALQAVDEMPQEPESVRLAIDLRFALRNCLQPLGAQERVAQRLREAETLAERIGDRARLGWVQCHLSDLHWNAGRCAEAAASAERALANAAERADLPLQVATRLSLGLVHHSRGDFALAQECFGWNVVHLRGARLRQRFGLAMLPSAYSRSLQAWSLAETGDFAQARVLADAAESLCLEMHDSLGHGYAMLGSGLVHLRQGELVLAVLALQRALAIAGFADGPVGRAFGASHLGYALLLADRAEEGLELLERTVAEAERQGSVARHALRLAYLAEAYLRQGRGPQADAVAERALHLARDHEERANEAHVLLVMGECALWRDSPQEAGARFRACAALAEALQMRPLQARAQEALARALEAGGEFGQGRTARRKSEEMATALSMQLCAPPTRGSVLSVLPTRYDPGD